jgi:putative tryptophan/tyrosine transport system substrate-binding protein
MLPNSRLVGDLMQFDRLKRREFVTLLGSVAACPLAARAQQPAMPVIGLIYWGDQKLGADRMAAFRQGLNGTGYVEGQNVAIEYRWAEGRSDLMPDLVADLVRRRVDIIATPGSTVATLAAKAATEAIPIVFGVSEDPVKIGLVTSLARPGGNLTGVNFFNTELAAKRLGLLRELVPGTVRVAVLVNRANAINAESTLRDVSVAASAVGLRTQVFNAGTSSEINAAFAALGRERPDVVFVGGDGFFNHRRFQLVNLASRHAIPTSYADRIFPEVGGRMSYGSDLMDMFRQVGAYAGRILKGTKPADLPVMQSTKLELVINAETARMLGITVPPSLLAIADEVLE